MQLDLVRLKRATFQPASPPQIRIRLGIPRADHSELCDELQALAARGVIRERRIEDSGWSVIAFEWGGA